MRARAPRQEAEPVVEPCELRPERIGHARLEPADHSRAPAGEHDAGLPRLAQHPIEAVHAPDGEHVGRRAAGDEDHVVRERERAQVGRRPWIEGEVRHLGIEVDRPRAPGSPCGRRAPGVRPRARRRPRAGRRSDSRRRRRSAWNPCGKSMTKIRWPVTRYVYDFDETTDGGRELLGGKGIGLAEMTQLGVPVPAGFTITTDACRAYMREGGAAGGARGRDRRAHHDSSRSGPASASATPPTRCSSPSARAPPSRCPG